MIFIETVNATQIRLYGLEQSPVCVDDADGLAQLRENKRPVILFASRLIQSKRFTHKLKNTALLDKVVVAELSTQLVEDSSHYHFAHAVVAGDRWVSWIKTEDKQHLQERFAAILPQIQGLSAMPLLLKLNANTGPEPSLYKDSTSFYALFDNELMTIPLDQATDYIKVLGLSDQPVKMIADWQPYLVDKNTSQLPNLWVDKQPTPKRPWAVWAFLLLSTVMLYNMNTYWDYQQTRQQVSVLQKAQNHLLKQVFPEATTADPYGRLTVAIKQSQQQPNLLPITRFFSILSAQSVTIKQLTIEAENHRITLDAVLSAGQKRQLTTAGFTLNQQQHYWEVSW